MFSAFIVLSLFVGCLYLGQRKTRTFLSLIILHLTLMTSVFLDPSYSDFPDHVTVLGSINVFFVDVYSLVSLLLFFSSSKASSRRIQGGSETMIACALTLLFLTLIGLATWTLLTSIEVAVNFWRPYLLPISLLLYVLKTTKQYSFQEIVKILLPIDMVLILLLFLRIFLFGLGEVDTNPGSLASTIRALNASGAFFLLSFLIVLTNVEYRIKHRNILIFANAFALVLTLQRTMIIAGLSILVYKSFNKGKAGGKTFVARLAYFSTLLGISLNYGFLVFFSEFRDASSTYTFGWRVEHWKDRLNTDRSFLDWLVGSILGPNGLTDPTVFRITSHNLYVDVLEFYGIFGLLTFLFLVISRFHGATPVIEKVTTSEITLVLLIFSVSYTPTPICFLLWGLICSKRYINYGYLQGR